MGADLDHHYDRKIIYSTDREHKSLYEWSLKELDAEGQQVGRDWIPWSWTLYFKAKDISLRESWSTQDRYPIDETKGKREAKERKFIRAELYPDSHDRWPPTYSMLGTDRKVSKFILHIEQISDDQDERCTADGIVSYTTEIDFRDVTDDDSLWIYFHFHAATFAHYAQRITSGEVDSLTVRIGHVAGFYSDWSPSITTDKIRILTADREHKVEGVPEDVTLRRLGEVGEAELYFARETKLPLPAPEPDEANDIDLGPDDRPVDRTALLEIAREKRAQETVKLIENLRIAAWVVAALLLALLFK
jgi:hypothetical protein